MGNKYIILTSVLLVFFLFLITSPISSRQNQSATIINNLETDNNKSNFIYVKYGDRVDIGHPRFSYLDTSRSSFIRGAWFDKDNNYMIIKLNGTYYHYCDFSSSDWINFSNADSFGSYYNSNIKGGFDCRIYAVPKY